MEFFGASRFFLPSYFLGNPFIIFILAGKSEDLLFNNFAGSIKNLDSLYVSIDFFEKYCFLSYFLTDFVGEVWSYEGDYEDNTPDPAV